MSLHPLDRLILHNGVVHTLDDAGTLAEAVGFAGGRIVAVGSYEHVRAAMPAADERDLAGAAVYPGFIDAHHHFCFAATFAGFPEVRSPQVRSIDDILSIVAAHVEQTPAGQWIVLLGFDETQLAEQRRPTRADLDAVAPAHPVLLTHFTYHEGVLNSRGLECVGFGEQYQDTSGGWLGRHRGHLDGGVFERCFGQAEAVARGAILARDREGWFARANAYQEGVLAAGITHACDAAVPPDLEALYRAWQQRGELHVGVTMMPISDAMLVDPSARLDGPATGSVDGRLALGALKLFLDGGVHCAMCFSLRDALAQFASMIGKLLRAPSRVPWRLALQQRSHVHRDGSVHTGLLYYDDAQLAQIVRTARERGFSIAMHAAGNAAIRQALVALGRSAPGTLPHRIEHFFFAEQETTRRAAGEGVVAIVQPAQLVETADWILQTGLPRGLAYHGYRQMLDAGMTLVGSSDAPVVGFDVLHAIATAVGRRTRTGVPFERDQAISVSEALRMYTRSAATALGLEREIGQLIPGARADAVVLSGDLETTAVDRIATLKVRSTFAGRIEHRQLR